MKHTTQEFPVSPTIARMQSSATLAAMQAATRMRAEGIDVVDFGAGEPDFDTPAHIKHRAIDAMRHGETKYTPTAGTKPFVKAITDYYKREFDVSIDAADVMGTAGGKQGIFNAVVALASVGDEVLIAKPYWVSFPEMVTFAGATSAFIETEDNEFQLTAEHVRRSITPRTKLLIINSPSNPSGRVVPKDEFRRIVETCAERGVYVISDECYVRFVYPPGEVFSATMLPAELRDYVCVSGSFSKTYAMTGWRIGYTIATQAWTKAMLKIEQHSTSNPCSISQAAAIEAFNANQDCVAAMLNEYQARRDWLIPALNEIPGLRCTVPEGAFYAFPDVRGNLKGELKTSADFADLLLNEAQTVVTDGAGFGAEGFVRISYATSLERLQEGVRRIRDVVERLT